MTTWRCGSSWSALPPPPLFLLYPNLSSPPHPPTSVCCPPSLLISVPSPSPPQIIMLSDTYSSIYLCSFVSGTWTLFLICLPSGSFFGVIPCSPSFLVYLCVLPLNLPSGELLDRFHVLHPTTLPTRFITVCMTLVNMFENTYGVGIYAFYI